MSSSDSDSSEFEDIQEFFSESEWKELSCDEKKSYRNASENYNSMQRCGLAFKPPHFMIRQLQPEQQQKLNAGEDSDDDEMDVDWCPNEVEAKLLSPATGKENVDPAADSSSPSPSTARVRVRKQLFGDGANQPLSADAPGTSSAPRYPKRPGARRSYDAKTETEIDDDCFLFCDDCGREWPGDCPEHKALKVIADTEVAVGDPQRALLTVPRQIVVKLGEAPGETQGVWFQYKKLPKTAPFLPKRVRFGPYEGDIPPANMEDGRVHGQDMTSSNWMQFVNCARHAGQENLYPFQFKGRLYFRTLRSVSANKELLLPVSYCDPAQENGSVSRIGLAASTFLCEHCSRSFVSPLLLAQHQRTTTCLAELRERRLRKRRARAEEEDDDDEDKPYSCGICGAAFAMAAVLRNHMRAHPTEKGSRPYACGTCGESFTSAGVLENHRVVHTATEGRPHRCPTCDAGYDRVGSLRDHLRAAHAGVEPHRCHMCPAAFLVTGDLKKHIKTHAAEKPYRCATCGVAAYTTSSGLSAHMKTAHSDERPHTCETCGKSFAAKGSLAKHLVMHSEEKPHRCHTCGACFARLGSLRVHMAVHTDERPFHCEICDTDYKRKATLRKHELKHHR